MKHLLPLLLLSCTAPALPAKQPVIQVVSGTDTLVLDKGSTDVSKVRGGTHWHKDTATGTETITFLHHYADTSPFIVMFTPERYVEWYPDKDSLTGAGNKDSIIHGLTRLLYTQTK